MNGRRNSPRARRDPNSVAEQMEAYAERAATDEAWLVAADAWEEANSPERARYAYLRHILFEGLRRQHPALLTSEEARWTRERYDRWKKAAESLGAGRSWTPEQERRINDIAKTRRPSSAQVSHLEVYEFLRKPPEHLFAYYTDNGQITTFMGDVLGSIVERGSTTRPFGNTTRTQHVTVRAINGFMYNGRCNLDTGTYCKLKRGKSWLKR